MATAETAEEISKKPEVRQALSQTSGPKAGTEKVKAATKDKFWFVTHALPKLLAAVNAAPEKTKFPKGDAR